MQKAELRFDNRLIPYFLHKLVVVETDVGEVIGVLRRYEMGTKQTHRPTVLILEIEGVLAIVRAWNTIATHELIRF